MINFKEIIKPVGAFTAKTITNVAENYVKYPEKKSNLLTMTYLVSTIASSTCQLLSIKQNKNISEEKKSFLLFHETIDAVLNAGLFFSFTKFAGDLGKILVDKGKILPKAGIVNNEYKSGVGVLFSIAGSIIATCIVTPIVRNKLAAMLQKRGLKNEISLKDSSLNNNFDTGQTFNNTPILAKVITPADKIKKPLQMNEFLYSTKNHLYKI